MNNRKLENQPLEEPTVYSKLEKLEKIFICQALKNYYKSDVDLFDFCFLNKDVCILEYLPDNQKIEINTIDIWLYAEKNMFANEHNLTLENYLFDSSLHMDFCLFAENFVIDKVAKYIFRSSIFKNAKLDESIKMQPKPNQQSQTAPIDKYEFLENQQQQIRYVHERNY